MATTKTECKIHYEHENSYFGLNTSHETCSNTGVSVEYILDQHLSACKSAHKMRSIEFDKWCWTLTEENNVEFF